MSIIATAVRHLMAAGVTGDALLQAIAEMEAEVRAEPKPRSKGAERTARWRERKQEQASQNVTCDESDDGDASPLSRPPNEINNSNPPTHTPEKQTRARKGHRLPDDWEPAPLTGSLAAEVAAWPPGAIERELARFRDWAASATGPNARKSDWQAAWRNWLRKAHDEGRYLKNDRPNRQNPSHQRASVREIAERAVGNGTGGSPAQLLPGPRTASGYG